MLPAIDCRHQGAATASFLLLLCSIPGLCSSQVVTPPSVNTVLGETLTLECVLELENVTLIQSTWMALKLKSDMMRVAMYNSTTGTQIVPSRSGRRTYFRSPSSHDATIVLEDVGFDDVGIYICRFITDQTSFQASTTVNVLVEPKVYVSAGSSALIDGSNATVVATCIAERARPPAEVSWESNLFGQSEVQLSDEVNGTTSTRVRYLWQPIRHVEGHKLTCVVRHPTLLSDIRIGYLLDVQFAPNISVVGYDGDWYVGQERVQITCKANANPPAHHCRWIRLDSEMPEGVEVMNNTLRFLRPLQRNDSGVYRCEVANDINLHSRDVSVLIQDPPTMPSTNTPTIAIDPHGLFRTSTPDVLLVSNQGSIVGLSVGVSLFLLLLLLCLVGVYLQRTRFSGAYTLNELSEMNS